MIELVAGYVVPVVSIALTYVVGRLHATQSDKRVAYKEAYDEFYLPFISLLYQTQIWSVGFAYLNPNERHKLFTLISQNIKYMNEEVLESVDILYGSYSAVLGKEILEMDTIFTHDRTNEVFDELTEKVLCRATWLAKKLHQPQLGRFVLELYLDETDRREKRREEALLHSGHDSQEASASSPT